jgi:membrane carboxypeptidase/penicillin-binding protein
MNAILVKLFATALTLSQVTTRPEAVRTQFDPVSDRAEVQKILRDGCAHMRKAFDIEDLNLDELIATAMEDPQAVAGNTKILQGLDLRDLHGAYREFCKNETVTPPVADLAEVIAYYNKAAADLPDHAKLKGGKLPGASLILDGKGERFAEVYEPDNRRLWVPLADVPESVRKAFVAAEDKRFFGHKGIDERGVIRAFIGNLAKPGRPQGGSTITQQVAKNLLVGDDVTYERKIREMIVASRLERTLTKDEILELYLNTIYLGRASWGVEMAARSWFGKSVKSLTLEEAALLAGLPKGPNFYSPDRFPERAQERQAYVLNRMKEDGAIPEDEMRRAMGTKPRLAAFERPRRDLGLHFVDHLGREAKTFAGVDGLTGSSYVIRSTVDAALQRATETALQEGLARYELNTGRMRFEGAEANLSEAIRKLEAPEAKADGSKPLWLQALERARLPLYDVHWPAAVVVEKGRSREGSETIRVGLADGRVVPLNAWSAAIRRSLKLHDVVRVRVVETRGQEPRQGSRQRTREAPAARAELRVRPAVQGAALVLENKTGRILAMSGGFSYPLSQLNRATQAHRQPGSTLKPLTYLAALAKGLQPNTLVWDTPVTLPPVGGRSTRAQDYWSPRNYDRGSAGLVTLRRALENSKNLVTARLLDGAIDRDPEKSLSRVCELAMEAQLYLECERYYPFVLGAQPVRLVDLAAFYAAIANEGARPTPYALERVEEGGRTVYAHADKPPVRLGSADRVAFYQVKTMLQGVVERGTAASIRRYAPYIAGKTGTTDKEGDAWFVGFTNDITVAVWVGYDNADGKRRTLGPGQTGAKVAIPIFSAVLEAAWANGVPKVALAPPSEEARRLIADLPIDIRTGDPALDRRFAFVEHFRRDPSGQIAETQHRLVPHSEAYAARDPYGDGDDSAGIWGDGRTERDPYARRGPYAQAPPPWWRDDPGMRQPQPQQPGWWRQPTPSPWWDDEDPRQRRSRRIDPDYFWQRQIY